ncbi:MAG TPA: non-heme iron oxygenase ferredoxin subunit [Candidatus Binatia bacterium]|nr:non-heme iron oxygenase ferredoxin subunit [Candidatus Binatia bacterium]
MFVKLCDKNILAPGEPRSFKIKGHEILAVKVGGKIYCLDGRCTHAGAPIAEGTLGGEVLTCPWHYSQFNITTGEVLRGPADKPLKIYPVEERENSVFIDL